MFYEAGEIANYFLKKAASEKEYLTHMKLKVLIYFSYGWYLVFKNEPLLNEHIESWSYGPVIPSIYHQFKEFGTKEIDRLATYFDPDLLSFFAYDVPNDVFLNSLLDKIWKVYGKFTGIQLANMTHNINGPWYKTHMLDKRKGTNIPDTLLKNWFTSLALANKKLRK